MNGNHDSVLLSAAVGLLTVAFRLMFSCHYLAYGCWPGPPTRLTCRAAHRNQQNFRQHFVQRLRRIDHMIFFFLHLCSHENGEYAARDKDGQRRRTAVCEKIIYCKEKERMTKKTEQSWKRWWFFVRFVHIFGFEVRLESHWVRRLEEFHDN